MIDPTTTSRPEAADADATASEIRRLRAEVRELRTTLAGIRRQSENSVAAVEERPLLKMAATIGITFALGKIIQALRLPTAAAVAIPFITTEVNRRIL